MADAGAVKTHVLREIDRRQDEFVDLCCRIVRFRTENPPSVMRVQRSSVGRGRLCGPDRPPSSRIPLDLLSRQWKVQTRKL